MQNFAVIGSGPAGLYATEALLKAFPDSHILVIDSLFSPYGLVRSGVAPDHYKIKSVTKKFDEILAHARVSFLGNLTVGFDISIPELSQYFDAILFATGSLKDRVLGIPGENLAGTYSATSFVGWYNKHPKFADEKFNLEVETASIIGQGNVAIDIARILLKPPSELTTSDISELALETLYNSKVREVRLIGRRGPLQIACTDKELKELSSVRDLDIVVDPKDLILTSEEESWLFQAPKGIRKNFEILQELSQKFTKDPQAKKVLFIQFFLSPVEILGTSQHISKISYSKNTLTGPLDKRQVVPTSERIELNTDILFKSVGYLGTPVPSLPFDENRGTIPHICGRVFDKVDETLVPTYVSGWIKRGPSGIIGTNKADSVETVATMLEDAKLFCNPQKKPLDDLYALLIEKSVTPITYEMWKRLEAEEHRLGQLQNRASHKFKNNLEALAFLKLS